MKVIMGLPSFDDLRASVYQASREGKVHRLHSLISPLAKEEQAKVVNGKINGATALIMSCRNGHFPVVEYLVERCGADVEQAGSVTFDGETIDGAPPLWCAAAAGYLNIVKFLVKAGAGVNKTTFTNSTPLRAACFDGHFEVVQYLVDHNADLEIANRHGHTCLMISCYKGHHKIVKYLIDKRADIDRKSLKGNTALHDCAESGSLDIMKLLLSYGAQMERDSYGMTPLLAAAVTGHTRIVEFLISRPDCCREQKIDALELIGATYVDKKRDMLGALKFWKSAMLERYHDRKNVLEKAKTSSRIAAYENAVEVTTMEELDDLISDPDDMRMQALLVRERILGPAHPDTSYYIRYRGAVYADMGNFDRCIVLWMYALEMQQKILEPLSPMTQSSFLSFAELFSFMMTETRSKKAHPVSIDNMLDVFDKAVHELVVGVTHVAKITPSERDASNFNRLIVILMHLTSLLCKVQATMTKDHEHLFKKLAYKMVHIDARGNKRMTPLHLACSKDTTTVGRYPVCSFPSTSVISLLLDVGSAVNAVDDEHNAPLHVAVLNNPCRPDIIQLLLRKGAHLDACNKDAMTPVELLKDTAFHEIAPPLNYLTLQCLAAKVVVKHDIPYKGHVPEKLENFIGIH